MFTGVGINLPQDDETAGPAALVDYAAAAEREGYESLWVSESVHPGVLDPLAVLNFVAATTRRALLGSAVLLAAYRSPLRLARELATVDRLSGGRLVVGAGLGNDRGEYARHGIVPGHRGRHFEAGLRLLRDLLTRDRVTARQRWWDLDDTPRPLAPANRSGPPLWIGARQPAALRRAVLLGDGWVGAGSMPQRDFERALTEVRRLAAAERTGEFAVAKRVYLHVTDDPGRMPAIRDWFARHYGRAGLADEVVVVGDADTCAAHLTRLRELGVGTLILHPVIDMPRQRTVLAREVLPAVPAPGE